MLNAPHLHTLRGSLALAIALGGGAALAATADAATAVSARTALEAKRIDAPDSAALLDGRIVLGWSNGSGIGDTASTMVRPAGGVLPGKAQGLRQTTPIENVSFLAGGPAEQPVLGWFQDTDARVPFQTVFDGERFGAHFAIVGSGQGGRGRFASYARCPDGTTAFTYQFTYDTVPTVPTTYATYAILANAAGVRAGSSVMPSAPGSRDLYQHPAVTCDRTDLPLFSIADDPDYSGTAQGKHLRVYPLKGPLTALLQRDLPANISVNGSPEARVAPDGRVWMLWTEFGGSATSYVATRAPGATGTATSGSVLDAGGNASTLFFGAGGTTHVLIRRTVSPGKYRYGIRTVQPGPANDSFGPEEPLVGEGNHYVQVLTDHPDGIPRLLVVTYEGASSVNLAVQGIPQAGSTEPLTSLDFKVNGAFTTSYLPSGDLFVAGREEIAPGRHELREGGLDTGVPPTLANVTVPGTTVPGEPTTLSVDARDPLGLSSFTWTVDGKTLTDEDTTHTFTTPGTYVATARAVDRAGLATELTRTIRVLDPAAVTPGTDAFREAVKGAGGAVDGTAPALTATTATRGRKGKAATSVTLKATPDEPVAFDLELVGTVKRGGLNGDLVLRSGRIASAPAGKPASAALKIPAALTRLVGSKLRVRITATDAAGNRTQRTVAVTRAKR